MAENNVYYFLDELIKTYNVTKEFRDIIDNYKVTIGKEPDLSKSFGYALALEKIERLARKDFGYYLPHILALYQARKELDLYDDLFEEFLLESIDDLKNNREMEDICDSIYNSSDSPDFLIDCYQSEIDNIEKKLLEEVSPDFGSIKHRFFFGLLLEDDPEYKKIIIKVNRYQAIKKQALFIASKILDIKVATDQQLYFRMYGQKGLEEDLNESYFYKEWVPKIKVLIQKNGEKR